MYVLSETSIVVGLHAAFSNVSSVLTLPPRLPLFCPPSPHSPSLSCSIIPLYPFTQKGSISPFLKSPPY